MSLNENLGAYALHVWIFFFYCSAKILTGLSSSGLLDLEDVASLSSLFAPKNALLLPFSLFFLLCIALILLDPAESVSATFGVPVDEFFELSTLRFPLEEARELRPPNLGLLVTSKLRLLKLACLFVLGDPGKLALISSSSLSIRYAIFGIVIELNDNFGLTIN